MNNRHLTLLTVFITLIAALASCSSERHIDESPSLSTAALTLEAGETAEVTVSGTNEFSVGSSDIRVATAEADCAKGVVRITAVAMGSTRISVRTGRPAPLTVSVTVTQNEREPDISDQYGDASERFVSDNLTLRHDEGGIIFESDRRGRHTIVDLATGRRIVFDAGASADATPMYLDKATLAIDGAPVALRYASATRRIDSTVWYALVSTDNRLIVIVAKQ